MVKLLQRAAFLPRTIAPVFRVFTSYICMLFTFCLPNHSIGPLYHDNHKQGCLCYFFRSRQNFSALPAPLREINDFISENIRIIRVRFTICQIKTA